MFLLCAQQKRETEKQMKEQQQKHLRAKSMLKV